MEDLVLCLCKDDLRVKRGYDDYVSFTEVFRYSGGRKAGLKALLEMTKNIKDIVITAHGSKNELGDKEYNGLLNFHYSSLAEIINSSNFTGKIYLHICDGYEYGKKMLEKVENENVRIYGVDGSAKMKINKKDCIECVSDAMEID